MKTARVGVYMGLVLVLMASGVKAQLALPYYDRYSGSAEEYAFKISNTRSGAGKAYGGWFFAKSQEGRGVLGQSDGASGIGVKGWASKDGNIENFGGHFCATGQKGVGVYGWAENTGNVVNYGGKFLAEGIRGIGIHAEGGANGQAGKFDGDVKIVGSGKGIIFPDGSKMTTASGPGSGGGSGGPVIAMTSTDGANAVYGKATGKAGIAIYGVAEYDPSWDPYMEEDIQTGNTNYGGYFIAEGPTQLTGGFATQTGIGIYAKGSQWAAYLDGDVRIAGDTRIAGDVSADGDVTIRGGNLRISSAETGNTIIELGEGLDYAEGFDVVDKLGTRPGTVLVIDTESPGQLKMSSSPYDTRVAGIAAGAKGLGSGVRLGGEQFDCDVALAGRVYCNVDATNHAIQPGDLLTTSSISGYAMKVEDYTRAQGAILGKAMEDLEKGKKGQILVLVTLQ